LIQGFANMGLFSLLPRPLGGSPIPFGWNSGTHRPRGFPFPGEGKERGEGADGCPDKYETLNMTIRNGRFDQSRFTPWLHLTFDQT